MKVLPILLSDSYKQFHYKMYPKGLTKLYSNMTPRNSRLQGIDEAVWFGLQYYIKEYLINQWQELFFKQPLEKVIKEYKRFHKNFSGVDMETEHIEKLHKLGYLPLRILALEEGSKVPMKVPFFTIENTHDDFAWLVNFLETAMSTVIWDLTTIATISNQYKEVLNAFALATVGNTDFTQWQGHDFSMRGRSSIESTYNQAGHLITGFTGTDTIPAILFLEEYYGANIEKELVGASVPATEHSVMMCDGKACEIDTIKGLLTTFPEGILSVVSDTWDLWEVINNYLPQIKEQIMSRNGKLVIRPDSGDPVEILCGLVEAPTVADITRRIQSEYWHQFYFKDKSGKCFQIRPKKDSKSGEHEVFEANLNKVKGVVELLWDIFGGTTSEQGYKVLDSHIGVIYGDSITIQRCNTICERLYSKKFASTNWVAGIGSYTMNYNTRDSLGIAVKATNCVVNGESREIFKDPITDNGIKKSAKGLLAVYKNEGSGAYELVDQVTRKESDNCELKVVFENGKLVKETTLAEIRKRLSYVKKDVIKSEEQTEAVVV